MRTASLLGFALAAVLTADEKPSTCMSQVFADEFIGSGLSASRWSVAHPELAKVFNGKLSLGFQMTPEGPRGAGITSLKSFHQQSLSRNRIGAIYFEAHVRLNRTPGHRGVFRVRNHRDEELPFADLAFQGGGRLAYPWARLSSQGGTRDFLPEKGQDGYLGESAGGKSFNTYGVRWSHNQYAFFLNNIRVMQIDNPEPAKGFVVSLQHAAYESDRKDFDPKAVPDVVEIDWVRVWAHLF